MMNTAEQKPDTSDPELLLPWYATGKLTQSETALVEAWLADNKDARDHLERSLEEMDLTVRDSESLGAPKAGALQALMAEIAAEKPAPAARQNWMEKIAEFFTPKVLAAAAAAVIAIFAAQTATIGVLLQREVPAFETASAPTDTAPDGTVVLMAFQPSATVEQINELLNGSEATVVGGPDTAGIYRIVVANGPDAETALRALENAEIVRFFAETQ
ncbi:hypothetical protein [Hoeflea sp.]|uniref:hypothetical protein n=1 Tax=Hoeflea sp. TaxID=1940281 RepID=UPI003B01AFD4